MISEGPVTLVAPILAVEPRVVFPRPVIGNTPPDLNDILPLLDLDSGRPIAELIHALHVPEEPVDNCPRDIKWNNPPNPNDEGTPIPSNIDWNDHDPNKVTADDLVSNGRSILAVRSWARTSIGDSSRRSSAVTESGRSTAGTSAPTPIESRRSPKSFSDSTSVAPRTSRSRGRSSETVRSTDLRVLRQAARLLPRSHPHS